MSSRCALDVQTVEPAALEVHCYPTVHKVPAEVKLGTRVYSVCSMEKKSVKSTDLKRCRFGE